MEPTSFELAALLEPPESVDQPPDGLDSRQARNRLVDTLARHLQAYVSG